MMTDRSRAVGAGLCLAALLGACSPVIRVEAPDKPIEINLNVRVEQDVKVRVDRELQKVVGKNPAAP
ncbi:MAG: YnbE family lipoprotein [Inquilinus limosus]|uniref:YnbE family lipoprotein n=1 Tax=Inquilinus limosus TaxID=171674 RepID=A0A952KCW3_9PROT|nr:YnbE family lipoprotein [Inquilinus limosus]